jgi:prephenate dehydrogenase
MNKFKLGIIGGNGKFGLWFRNLLKLEFEDILIADIGTAYTNFDICRECNIIIITVPLNKTLSVLEALSDHLREDQLLVEITSIKEPFLKILNGLKCEVLQLHPMFAPIQNVIDSQLIIFHKLILGGKSEFFLNILNSKGLKLKESEPKKHDEMMAVIQGLFHSFSLALGVTFRKLNISVEETLSFSSPVYKIQFDLMARILAQDCELYQEIAMLNPVTPSIIEQLAENLSLISNIIKNQDRDGYKKEFTECAKNLEKFIPEAFAESCEIIESLLNKKNS